MDQNFKIKKLHLKSRAGSGRMNCKGCGRKNSHTSLQCAWSYFCCCWVTS